MENSPRVAALLPAAAVEVKVVVGITDTLPSVLGLGVRKGSTRWFVPCIS